MSQLRSISLSRIGSGLEKSVLNGAPRVKWSRISSKNRFRGPCFGSLGTSSWEWCLRWIPINYRRSNKGIDCTAGVCWEKYAWMWKYWYSGVLVCMNAGVLVLGSTSTHECRSIGTRVGVLVLFTYFWPTLKKIFYLGAADVTRILEEIPSSHF